MTAFGDGSTTQFTYVGPAVFVTDWQGSQVQRYPTARTNLLLASQTQGNTSYWTTTNATVSGGVADPAGGTNAFTITSTAGNGYLNQYTPPVTPGNYVGTIWIRRRTGSGTVYFRSPDNAWHTVAVTASWKPFSWAGTVSSGGTALGVLLATNGDAVDIAFGQVEAGATPTSYIPTTTTAVTRTDYSVSGNTLTFAAAPVYGAVIYGVAGVTGTGGMLSNFGMMGIRN